MIYPFVTLKAAALVLGLLLIATHLMSLLRGEAVREWLRTLPRSPLAGTVLLTVAAAWFFAMVLNMDLGEFSPYRRMILAVTVAGYFLMLKFAPEFLAARALGMVLLLAAEPVLETTFMRPEMGRYLLVVLAYGWIVKGLFWVGMPYLMRDQIAWVCKSDERFRMMAAAGLIYGAALCGWGLTLA